jgi:hypothetical protein
MAVAVLRVSDQRREKTPAVCVKSGEATQSAVKVTAIGMTHADRWQLWLGPLAVVVARLRHRPLFQVILPVSQRSWRRVLRGRMWSLLVAGVAVAIMARAVYYVGFASLASSWVILIPAWLLRARFHWSRWVGLEYLASHQDIRVTRAHPAFAEAARVLWLKSLPRL